MLFFSGQGPGEVRQYTRDGWLGMGFPGVFCSRLAYIAWFDALKAMPVAQTGVFLYLEPLVTVVVAALIPGESLLLASLLGGALILLGVWLVNRRRWRR